MIVEASNLRWRFSSVCIGRHRTMMQRHPKSAQRCQVWNTISAQERERDGHCMIRKAGMRDIHLMHAYQHTWGSLFLIQCTAEALVMTEDQPEQPPQHPTGTSPAWPSKSRLSSILALQVVRYSVENSLCQKWEGRHRTCCSDSGKQLELRVSWANALCGHSGFRYEDPVPLTNCSTRRIE